MTPRRRWAWLRLRLRLRSPFLTLFLLVLLFVADTTGVLRVGLLCAWLHECGHVMAFCLLERRIPRLEVSLAGICLSMRGVTLPPGRMLLLAASGPAVNLLLAAGAMVWMPFGGYSYFGLWFTATNLLVGGTNLLPLPGLDGGQMMAALRQWLSACRW